MPGFKPFKPSDHIRVSTENSVEELPQLLNAPPQNGIFHSFLSAIFEKYKEGKGNTVSIRFLDDGIEVEDRFGTPDSVSDKAKTILCSLEEMGSQYGIAFDWKDQDCRICHSALCVRKVLGIFRKA